MNLLVIVTNESTVLTDAQVQAVIPALQKQVSEDFFQYWTADCTLQFLAKDQPLPAEAWQMVILDDADQAGALGYHELSSQGTPLGKVFARLDIQNNLSWTVTVSHELLEMLGDPWIDLAVVSDNGIVYAMEVADAVEDDSLGYQIDGVLVSDFVTPKWFNPSIECDRYSFRQNVTQAFEIAAGGYIGTFEPGNGWTQITQSKAGEFSQTPPTEIPVGSRRFRRNVPKRLWKHSKK